MLKTLSDSLLHLLFPHICDGCGSDRLSRHSALCLSCLSKLPKTYFEGLPANPVEKGFWGRLPLAAATAHLYFTKASLVQFLMHQLKYRGRIELGLQLGQMMGESLAASGRFEMEALVPLPLFPSRERKRGYNQSAILCTGISKVLKIPVLDQVICRPAATETQTRKNRVERWQNMEGKFLLTNETAIRDRKILLVDDVLTTGATLESCGMELLRASGVQLSIATLCFAFH